MMGDVERPLEGRRGRLGGCKGTVQRATCIVPTLLTNSPMQLCNKKHAVLLATQRSHDCACVQDKEVPAKWGPHRSGDHPVTPSPNTELPIPSCSGTTLQDDSPQLAGTDRACGRFPVHTAGRPMHACQPAMARQCRTDTLAGAWLGACGVTMTQRKPTISLQTLLNSPSACQCCSQCQCDR